jgi:hydroxyacylglutathione hydrolase
MKLLALPAFADNYIWMLHDGASAVVVDPGDAAPVHAALDEFGLDLAAILVTHKHADHIGGVDALRPRLLGPVLGPAHEPMPQPCRPLHEGDRIEVLGMSFRVLEVPGHTTGHIAYAQCDGAAAPLLFCGDTLFSAGCGRLFEGSPAQMADSLERLVAGPADTRVCCTHEYTLSNLRFAAAVEPGNRERAAYEQRCQALREDGQPTLPSTIATELRVNPFLRCTEPEVVAAALAEGALGSDPLAVFTSLREWKNRFR